MKLAVCLAPLIKAAIICLAGICLARPLLAGTIDFKQAANEDAGFSLGSTHWIGAVVQDSNSRYYEGMDVLQRVLFTGVPPTTNNHHSLLFRHQFTKGGQHGYDFLTSYAQAQVDNAGALGVTTVVNACGQDIASAAAPVCSALQSANFIDVVVPSDPFISKDGSTASKIAAYEAGHGPRTIRIFGDAPFTYAALTMCHDVPDGGDTSDSFALYALVWDSASTNILIQMAGHLAISGDGTGGSWGTGVGSGFINGGSYHFKLDSLAGALTDTNCPPGQNKKEIVSLGSQDNAFQSTAFAPPPPPCNVAGLAAVCPFTTNVYQAASFGPNLTYAWSISGNGSILGTTTTSNITVVAGNGGSYTVSVTIREASGPFTTNSTCSLPVLVHTPPPCAINGATTVCPSTTNSYAGPPGMVAYKWVVSGGGAVSGPSTNQVVSVAGSSGCNTNFSLTLKVIDTNGCFNTCTQTVIVQDITPPTITCPPPFNAAESPRYSGGAFVNYPLPTATDNCTAHPRIFNSPLPGSRFAVGTNIVNSTAVDDCNNSNSCSFTVRVIPYQLVVTTTNDSGYGSLRQAILDGNDSPDENLVVFNLSGPPPYTIRLASALPTITSPIIIDGWSQSGSNNLPVIEVVGPASNSSDGLVITVGNNTVRGLDLHGFATAIRLAGAGSNVVHGCFVGTDLTGTNSAGNSANGIYINSAGNTIGGTTPGTGNVISGNGSNGVVLASASASNNLVQGNSIGAGFGGAVPLGNGANGVFFTDQAGNNLIGGTNNGTGNIISFNGKAGISLDATAGTQNGLLGNRIVSNAALAIDLGADGVTLNHTNGPVSGPNNFQNFPEWSDVHSIEGITTLLGKLSGIPNTTYRVEFYLDDNADPSGFGQAQTFIGATYVTTPDTGLASFTAAFPLDANYTQFVAATATDPFNNTSEFSHAGHVRTPPVLGAGPVSTNVSVGRTVTLCATATGTPPIQYQWRLNGWNIPGATNACYTVPSAQVARAGSYTLLVGNDLGAFATIPARMTLVLTNVPPGTNFAGRVTISGTNGLITGSNRAGFPEPGEPLHAGQPGGHPVWYTWTAPVTGVVTVDTAGSTFDTLLAIYTGSTLTNLVPVASDEGHGGFYNSLLFFNAFQGTQYRIAIDGFAGDSGDFILSWQEQNTSHLLPIFLTQPTDQTVALGQNATFTALAARLCGNGQTNCNDPNPQLFYQWYFFGNPIPGATNNIFTVTNVQPAKVGTYTLFISTPYQTNPSVDVVLQINLTGSDTENVLATDKLQDATQSLVLGSTISPSLNTGGIIITPQDSIVRGYTGTQIFNTTGSATSPAEVICGVIGGASDWVTIVPATSGTLHLDTAGSSYQTVMALYIKGTNGALQSVDCNKGSGSNSMTMLNVPVMAGQTNYVDIDGVNGASGVLQLNYSLVTSSIIKTVGMTPQGPHLQILGHTNMHFTLQASSNLVNWKSLFSATVTNATFDYIDTGTSNATPRYYRALMLP